jgi:hypothetical protein
MLRVEEIIGGLLASTAARGVWFLGGTVIRDNRPQNEVIASAAHDDSVTAPVIAKVETEMYFDFREWKLFAYRIGAATLVFVFDDGSSLGLIRLRVRQESEAIKTALSLREG